MLRRKDIISRTHKSKGRRTTFRESRSFSGRKTHYNFLTYVRKLVAASGCTRTLPVATPTVFPFTTHNTNGQWCNDTAATTPNINRQRRHRCCRNVTRNWQCSHLNTPTMTTHNCSSSHHVSRVASKCIFTLYLSIYFNLEFSNNSYFATQFKMQFKFIATTVLLFFVAQTRAIVTPVSQPANDTNICTLPFTGLR